MAEMCPNTTSASFIRSPRRQLKVREWARDSDELSAWHVISLR
jgi:hypothetical protein